MFQVRCYNNAGKPDLYIEIIFNFCLATKLAYFSGADSLAHLQLKKLPEPIDMQLMWGFLGPLELLLTLPI